MRSMAEGAAPGTPSSLAPPPPDGSDCEIVASSPSGRTAALPRFRSIDVVLLVDNAPPLAASRFRQEASVMCFSAIASFTAAAVTGGIGLVTLGRVSSRAEAPLAAVPLLFAVQQAIEGSLWLALEATPPQADLIRALTLGFLVLAEFWWPVFVPVAVLLAEPDRMRRRLIWPLVPLGIVVGLWLLWAILTREHQAVIVEGHLVYASEGRLPFGVDAAYFAAVMLPPLLSSRRAVALLGAIVLVGAGTAYIAYWQAFVSVWCFFAAIASGVILWHFEHARRQPESGLRT